MPEDKKSILWVAQKGSGPLRAQLAALHRTYPGAEIVCKEIWKTEDIVVELQQGRYIDWVFLGPESTLAALLRILPEGMQHPLRPVVKPALLSVPSNARVMGGACIAYGFQRVHRLELREEDVVMGVPGVHRVLPILDHDLGFAELAELRRLWPKAEILPRLHRKYDAPFECIHATLAGRAQVCVLVAPYPFYEAVVAEGIYTLRGVMNGNRFQCYRRVLGVTREMPLEISCDMAVPW